MGRIMTIFDTFKKQLDLRVNSQTVAHSTSAVSSAPLRPHLNTSLTRNTLQPPTTFEEVYKTSYSHGLEAIYAIENVDLKSVKRLNQPSKIIPVKEEIHLVLKAITSSPQLELDLGNLYRGWMSSFVLHEPIQVLGLSKHAEKCLIERDKIILKDLIGTNLRDFVFVKGMGQGHIDEVEQKLSVYLEGRELNRCYTIDFQSWIRSLVASLDFKKVFVGLEQYRLEDLISLSPAENVEVRRLTAEKKKEWKQEINIIFQEKQRRDRVRADFETIVDVFIKPWIRSRMGIATKLELMERLQQISENREFTALSLNFLSAHYFSGGFPLADYLSQVAKDVYCVDDMIANDFLEIVNTTNSYFYNDSVEYPYKQLCTLLFREYSNHWKGYPDGFLEKVLKYTSSFRVRKGPNGELTVRLNHIIN